MQIKGEQGKFELGDWVYLLLQQYRQKSVHVRHNLNLSQGTLGHFE